MSNERTTENNVISVQDEKELVVSGNKPNTSRSDNAQNNVSSQRQLLVLAKTFCIEGGIISTENQSPIEDRVVKRKRYSEFRSQKNLEEIIQKSIPLCSKDEIPDRTDQDWFNSFIELAKGIGNKTMQDLWAKILAYEISKPGSFSLKTLQTFRTMSIYDAKLLAKVAKYVVKEPQNKAIRILSGVYQQPGLLNFFDKNREHKINLNQYGISYSDLMALADNNILFLQEAETGLIEKEQSLNFMASGQSIKLTAKKTNCVLSFYKFTPIGTELLSLINDKSDNSFIDSLRKELSHHFALDNG